MRFVQQSGDKPRTAAEVAETLNIELDLAADDRMVDAVMLVRISNATTGEEGLVIGATAGMGWATQRRILLDARHILNNSTGE